MLNAVMLVPFWPPGGCQLAGVTVQEHMVSFLAMVDNLCNMFMLSRILYST